MISRVWFVWLTSLLNRYVHCFQSLRLHLDYSGSGHRRRRGGSGSGTMDFVYGDAWAAAYSGMAAGAALVAGLGVIAYLKRSGL